MMKLRAQRRTDLAEASLPLGSFEEEKVLAAETME